MVLFVNGCVRSESRTLALAQSVLSTLSGEVEKVQLYPEGPEGLTEQKLQLRQSLLDNQEYDHPMFDLARQFARAQTIVIAAPYWDLLFPARVRSYLEEVTVSGITFCYGSDGVPRGLCKASRLIYVTTAGGPVVWNLGFEYVKHLAESFYGIPQVLSVKAEGLDIYGADAQAILRHAQQQVPGLLHPAGEKD